MRTSVSVLCLLLLTLSRPAHAKVAAVPIEKLIASTDEIVIAKVTRVSASGQFRYATAEVQRALKGNLSGTIRFLASPTWVCDISEAKEGETVLLFLDRDKRHTFVIAHSGRGRMPLQSIRGKTYASIWGDIWLPKNAPVIENFVELPFLEALIVKNRGTKTAA